ncbi:hypothetical protein, partial [Methylobacterium radiotolerans]|uniref:hypothetical protein n=1 Tax=Methylobacterium radiotolerans TaxID=31998 RepID=UPI001AECAADA
SVVAVLLKKKNKSIQQQAEKIDISKKSKRKNRTTQQRNHNKRIRLQYIYNKMTKRVTKLHLNTK